MERKSRRTARAEAPSELHGERPRAVAVPGVQGEAAGGRGEVRISPRRALPDAGAERGTPPLHERLAATLQGEAARGGAAGVHERMASPQKAGKAARTPTDGRGDRRRGRREGGEARPTRGTAGCREGALRLHARNRAAGDVAGGGGGAEAVRKRMQQGVAQGARREGARTPPTELPANEGGREAETRSRRRPAREVSRRARQGQGATAGAAGGGEAPGAGETTPGGARTVRLRHRCEAAHGGGAQGAEPLLAHRGAGEVRREEGETEEETRGG